MFDFNFHRAGAAAILASALMLGGGAASANTIVDFSQNFGLSLSEGDVLTTFDFGGGLTGTITTSDLGSRATGEAMIFNTESPSISVGNDPDLAGPFQDVNNLSQFQEFGNALILQEDNSSRSRHNQGPDDAANGGAITFTFDTVVALTAIFILDGNDNGPTGASVLLDGSLFAQDLGGGDNQFERIDFAQGTLVNSFTVDFSGSGAIGRFGAAVVPVPAAFPLMLTGLGVFGWIAARRRKKAA